MRPKLTYGHFDTHESSMWTGLGEQWVLGGSETDETFSSVFKEWQLQARDCTWNQEEQGGWSQIFTKTCPL